MLYIAMRLNNKTRIAAINDLYLNLMRECVGKLLGPYA